MQLNKSQQSAIEHKSGPLLIIAGAGTGKTTVITQRILHIIEKKWATPAEILALTFTEKAAGEMEERIDISMPYGYEEIWTSTFHSFCDRVLRQEGQYIGLDINYTLMTQAQAYIFVRQHLFDFSLDIFRPHGNPTSFIGDLLKHFSRLQDEDVSVEEYISFAKILSRETDEEKELFDQTKELATVYKEYTELKIKESKFDFGDLIIQTLRLFREKKNVLKKYKERFKYVLVDEFQDTNYTQNVLVHYLALGKDPKDATKKERSACNLTVVGDDDQAIYKFRGAAISNILQFNKIYPEAKKVVLLENYRSRQEILDASYSLITHNNPYRLEETEGISKKLLSKAILDNTEVDPVKLLVAATASTETDLVAKQILALTGNVDRITEGGGQIYDAKGQSSFVKVSEEKEFKFSDIAILVRANSHSDEFVKTFRYWGIPYKFGGSRGLYSRPEVAVLISFLKILVDYTHNISIFNILGMKTWGLEPREIVDLLKYSKGQKISTFETLEELFGVKIGSDKFDTRYDEAELSKILSIDSIESIKELLKILHNAMKMVVENRSVGEILFMFFKQSGYLEELLSEETLENEFKVQNISRYFELLKEYEQNNTQSNVYEYVGYLEYSMEIGESPSVDADMLSDYDAVNIQTIHGAKGLEFPVVFMVNLVSDRFPTRNRTDRIPIPDGLIKEVLAEVDSRQEHIQEERRLFYVGATRAKERLYLSAANYYSGGKRRKKPSIFLNEVLDRDITDQFNDVVETVDMDWLSKQFVGDEDVLDVKKLNINNSVFSYSQLRLYERCPREYKYRYVLKIPTSPNHSLSFGSSIHNTLRLVFEQVKRSKEGLEGVVELPSLEDMSNFYEQSWISVGYEDKRHEVEKKKKGKQVLKAYYDSLDLESIRPFELEKKFKYRLEDILIRGTIDRIDVVGKEDGKTVVDIIDYKTGKVKSKSVLKKEWQLILYTIVVEEIYGFKVNSASYVFVEHNEKVVIEVNDKVKEIIKEKIKGLVKGIVKGDYTVRPEHDCRYSDYSEICDDSIL